MVFKMALLLDLEKNVFVFFGWKIFWGCHLSYSKWIIGLILMNNPKF